MARLRLALLLVLFVAVVAGCFPHHAGPRLRHFDSTAPAVGEAAPLFTLRDLDGQPVKLADLVGDKPIVLRFGSHSCPVYRYRRFAMEKLEAEFKDRVLFLIVYTIEAHPVGSKSPYAEGEWDVLLNRVVGVRVRQPQNLERRSEQARLSHRKLKLGPPMLVDTMDDGVWKAYGAASSPAFVIDEDGRIAARQVWIEPKQVRGVLLRLLGESQLVGE